MTRRLRLFGLSLAVGAAILVGEGGARSAPGSTAAVASPGRSPELEAAVRALVADRSLKSAQIGIVVMDCETGNVLAQSGEHTVLNPASNAKLYTAAAALAILHGSHKYQTTLSGTIEDGGAKGLTLRGHGDPAAVGRIVSVTVFPLRATALTGARKEAHSFGCCSKAGGVVSSSKNFWSTKMSPSTRLAP